MTFIRIRMWIFYTVIDYIDGKDLEHFINDGYVLHRFSAVIDGASESITLNHAHTEIGEKDTYEKCAKRLAKGGETIDADPKSLRNALEN